MGRPLVVEWRHSADELKALYRAETHHQDRTRLHALWLVRRGDPMRQVAGVIGVCYESVRRWVSWYRSGGLDEVRARRNGRSGGLPPRLSDEQHEQHEQHEQLKQRARQGELRTIHDGVRWAREEAGAEYT